jgi:arabinofuranan 3-O-arabinosyltransferase
LAAPVSDANLTLGFVADDDPHLARRFTLGSGTVVGVRGEVVPRPGLDILSQLPDNSPVSVSASSWLGFLPRFRAANLDDGGGVWVANLGDQSPTLTVRWLGDRTVSSVVLAPARGAAEARRAVITGADGTTVDVAVPRGGGILSFPPMVTDHLQIRLLDGTSLFQRLPFAPVPIRVPVGLSALVVPGTSPVNPGGSAGSTPVDVPCGAGPPLTIDGQSVPTSVVGTVRDVLDLRPMALVACGPGGAGVDLAAGPHLVEAADQTGPWKVTSVVFSSTGPTAAGGGARRATVARWGAQDRTVALSGGPATLLAVHENFNVGWQARLGHSTLRPVRIDGWKQGWLVPPGRAASVTMRFEPGHVFHIGLGAGAFLLLVLGSMAVVRPRRASAERWRSPDPVDAHRRSRLVVPAVVGVGAAVLVIVVGPLALTLVPIGLVARWRPRWVPTLVAGAMGVACVAVALHPGAEPGLSAGAFGPVPQAACAVALAGVVAALIPSRRDGRDGLWSRPPGDETT